MMGALSKIGFFFEKKITLCDPYFFTWMNLAQYNIDHINNFLIEFLWVFDVCVSMTKSHGSDFDGVLIAETSFIVDDYRRLWTLIFLAQHTVVKREK